MIKKILFLSFLAISMAASAQQVGLFGKKAKKENIDLSRYENVGAVPEENGKIVFRDKIICKGRSKETLYKKVASWAALRYERNLSQGSYEDSDFFQNLDYACVKSADAESGKIVCQGAEELIFSIKTLAKNYTQIFYIYDIQVLDGEVQLALHTISYNVDQGGAEFTRVNAEEWISDKECLNKKGKLRRIPGKFRIKTIDLVSQLTLGLTDTLLQ